MNQGLSQEAIEILARDTLIARKTQSIAGVADVGRYVVYSQDLSLIKVVDRRYLASVIASFPERFGGYREITALDIGSVALMQYI
ncbi:MAG: hypothetical protein Q8R30_05875 [bacterium]|nr:hypothetical protein [bacterium]